MIHFIRTAPLAASLAVVAALCLAGALALFLAYPAHAQVVSGPGSNRVTGFALHSDNADPLGVTGDADTIWVLNRSFTNAGDKIFAYKRSDGSRDTDQDFKTLNGAGNNTPTGLCSDGTTMWVADYIDDKAFAYRMSDKSHDPSKDITFASNHDHVNGLWCNTHTMWASEDDSDSDPGDKIFAYKLSDGTYDSDLDLDIQSSLNETLRGLWSNGHTMFVADRSDARVYAYRMSDGSRDSDRDIVLRSGNSNANGMWFDGRVLWVADNNDNYLYAHHLPGATSTSTLLSGALTVDIQSTVGRGYNAGHATNPGSLSTTTLMLDGTKYTVTSLYQDDGQGDPLLQLGVEPQLDPVPSCGFLVLDNDEFELSGAGTTTHDATGTSWQWPIPSITWTANDSVLVTIRQDGNTAATGAVTITGATEVGETLTADTSAIADADGLDDDAYHYQWVRVDGSTATDIADATGETYTPGAADAGKKLRVRAVFNDDKRFKEYPKNSLPSGTVTCPDIYCAELTVGSFPGGLGFESTTSNGALSRSSFTVGSTTYTVEGLGYAGTPAKLRLTVDTALPDAAAWALTLDGTEFAVAGCNKGTTGDQSLLRVEQPLPVLDRRTGGRGWHRSNGPGQQHGSVRLRRRWSYLRQPKTRPGVHHRLQRPGLHAQLHRRQFSQHLQRLHAGERADGDAQRGQPNPGDVLCTLEHPSS